MKRIFLASAFAAAVCLLVPTQVLAVDINFEEPVKIGDGQRGTIPTYGPGNQIVIKGDQIFVAWSAEDPYIFDPAFPQRRNDEVRNVQSLDKGQTWEGSDVIVRGNYWTLQGASLAVGSYLGNTYQHFAYGHRSGANQVLYVNSSDRTPIDVTGGLGISVDYLSRSIAADQNGNAFVCFGGSGAQHDVIYCSRFITDSFGVVSLDPAETASLASGPGNRAWEEPAIAMDSSGTLFGAWTEEINGVRELVLAKRVAAGIWEHKIIDRQGYEDYYASIDIADINGVTKICVSWAYNEIVVSCTIDEGVTWNTSVVASDEWADFRPSVAISPDGTVNVAWVYYRKDPIRFARQLKDKKGSKWEVVDVVIDDNVMDVKLDMGADGLAHLVYPGKDWSTLMYIREKPLVPTGPPRP